MSPWSFMIPPSSSERSASERAIPAGGMGGIESGPLSASPKPAEREISTSSSSMSFLQGLEDHLPRKRSPDQRATRGHVQVPRFPWWTLPALDSTAYHGPPVIPAIH